MHRLYPMFPLGLPGLGLGLLRLSVAITLWPLPMGLTVWLGQKPVFVMAAVLFIALIFGVFTPFAASLGLIFKLIEIIQPISMPMEWAVAMALICLALMLLGPGAYSMDSQLYGFRVLTLRPRR
ncbi:hypothetical protein DWU98_12960 [Dyella monticola]|uniref:DoxX family protein n=1 Tax=Dyella monticola TaxID=1927958 RepID=A0A370WXI0_9GAMM|nr:hypothetical protein DWU98_12960 [Dyella monticola]